MRTDYLEFLGLALLATSMALFSVTTIEFEPWTSLGTSTIDASAARTVAIAIRARAEGRAEHADALLASIVARDSPSSTMEVPLEEQSLSTTCLRFGYIAMTWCGCAALAVGLAGLSFVGAAARRRRRTFHFISGELGQSARSDDPGRIVVALYRLRAERAAALAQLQKTQALLDQASIAPLSPRGTRPSAVDSPPSSPDSNPHTFLELGRIIDITPIDTDCGYGEHPR